MKDRLITVALVLAALVVLPLAVVTVLPAGQEASAGVPGFYRQATLESANAITADEVSATFAGWAAADLIGFMVTCVEDSGTATLDIALQRSIDGGTTWANVIAMTQLAATGAETKLYADVKASTAQMIGDSLRVSWDVTGTGAYTCSTYLAGEG